MVKNKYLPTDSVDSLNYIQTKAMMYMPAQKAKG